MSMETQPALFVWRTDEEESVVTYSNYPPRQCIWCSSSLIGENEEHFIPNSFIVIFSCRFCGWSRKYFSIDFEAHPSNAYDEFYIQKELSEFPIDNKEVMLSEIGTHIRQNFSDAYSMPSRLFEELIADVFSHFGYYPILTRVGPDKGVDIYLFDGGGNKIGIVEVKRYSTDNTVGIGIVDRLRGVQLTELVPEAFLVTSSTFTSGALKRALAENPLKLGFAMNLVDAGELLKMLKVYNEKLPPLEIVMEAKRRDK